MTIFKQIILVEFHTIMTIFLKIVKVKSKKYAFNYVYLIATSFHKYIKLCILKFIECCDNSKAYKLFYHDVAYKLIYIFYFILSHLLIIVSITGV